jgi:hypothetical protein
MSDTDDLQIVDLERESERERERVRKREEGGN